MGKFSRASSVHFIDNALDWALIKPYSKFKILCNEFQIVLHFNVIADNTFSYKIYKICFPYGSLKKERYGDAIAGWSIYSSKPAKKSVLQ